VICPLEKSDILRLGRQLNPHARALPTCLVLACDLVLASGAAWLAQSSGFVARSAACLLLTLALLHFYLIHHECVHRSVFASDRCNVLLGELLGFVLVYPFLARRRSHMLHHVWAGHLDRDPANARARARLGALSARQRRILELLWRAWFPFLALNDRIGLWRSSFAGARVPRAERYAAYVALLGYLSLIAASALAPALAALGRVYLPAFVLLLVCEELINLPHHIEAPTVTRKLALWEQAEVTHSCSAVPFWSSVVLLHFNLHLAHHVFPTLPWFRLTQAERALRPSGLAARGSEFGISRRLRRARFTDVFAAYLGAP
jgi:fatty acid desaturase